MELETDSSVPFYIQITKYLQDQINKGIYPVGTRLPSERELAIIFKVSRMTARQALQAIRLDGFAYSRTGKGTYVRQPKIARQLPYLTSFSQEMQQRGLDPSSHVLKAEIEPADDEVSKQLQIPHASGIYVLNRVRLASGSPLGLETAHLVRDMCPGILERHDFSHESLYRVLREEYGCVLAWASQTIDARLPLSHESKLLDIDPGTPVLGMTRITFTQQDKAIEFTRAVYRADRYQLHIVLRLMD